MNLVHYSSQAGLTSLSPDNYGKGKANKFDLQSTVKKIFFFAENSTLGQDKRIFKGCIKYKTKIAKNKLYDLDNDKKNLYSWQFFRTEEKIKELGFKGYFLTRQDNAKVVCLFESIKINKG